MGMVSVFGCRNRYSPGDFSNDGRVLCLCNSGYEIEGVLVALRPER